MECIEGVENHVSVISGERATKRVAQFGKPIKIINNMKPFNLEEALAGKPVITGKGKKVTDLHYFKDAIGGYKLVACIDGMLSTYDDCGRVGATNCSEYNLFMEEPLIERWVNVFGTTDGTLWVGDECQSYETAVSCKDWECGDESYYIKTIKIDNRP